MRIDNENTIEALKNIAYRTLDFEDAEEIISKILKAFRRKNKTFGNGRWSKYNEDKITVRLICEFVNSSSPKFILVIHIITCGTWYDDKNRAYHTLPYKQNPGFYAEIASNQ